MKTCSWNTLALEIIQFRITRIIRIIFSPSYSRIEKILKRGENVFSWTEYYIIYFSSPSREEYIFSSQAKMVNYNFFYLWNENNISVCPCLKMNTYHIVRDPLSCGLFTLFASGPIPNSCSHYPARLYINSGRMMVKSEWSERLLGRSHVYFSVWGDRDTLSLTDEIIENEILYGKPLILSRLSIGEFRPLVRSSSEQVLYILEN